MANNTPKSPKLAELKTYMQTLDEIINSGDDLIQTDQAKNVVGLVPETFLTGLRDALEWTYVTLLNRRDYHKRRNITSKLEIQLLEERLKAAGVDTDKIKREASGKADDHIIDTSDDEV